MALILGFLEREADSILNGSNPDLELLYDAMHYMTAYPDAVHHPKEDRIYAELQMRRPDLNADFRRIQKDHRYISELSKSLCEMFQAMTAGQPIERMTIATKTLRYVEVLREHMRWEDLHLFRQVEAIYLTGHGEGDFEIAELVQEDDPLFGSVVKDGYVRLFDHIREGIDETCRGDETAAM